MFWTHSAFVMAIGRVKNTEPHIMSYPVHQGRPPTWPHVTQAGDQVAWRRCIIQNYQRDSYFYSVIESENMFVQKLKQMYSSDIISLGIMF